MKDNKIVHNHFFSFIKLLATWGMCHGGWSKSRMRKRKIRISWRWRAGRVEVGTKDPACKQQAEVWEPSSRQVLRTQRDRSLPSHWGNSLLHSWQGRSSDGVPPRFKVGGSSWRGVWDAAVLGHVAAWKKGLIARPAAWVSAHALLSQSLSILIPNGPRATWNPVNPILQQKYSFSQFPVKD